MRVVCYYNVIMRRDNFQLRQHGEAMVESAALFEEDVDPENQPSAEAETRFEWAQRGVGLYVAKNPEEQREWAQWIRRWSGDDNCNLMELSVTELMSGTNILPPRNEAERAIVGLSNTLDVSSRINNPNIDMVGVARMIADARVDPEETDVLIVGCPDVYAPGKFATIDRFELACNVGNRSALEAQERSKQGLEDDIESKDTRLKFLSMRLQTYIQEKINTIGDHEAIISALRTEGRQISPELADALEYEYCKRIRNFIDIGSSYRHIPPNVKIAFIVGPNMFDKMVGRSCSYGYSTVQEVQQLGIGVHGFGSDDPAVDSRAKWEGLREEAWSADPGHEMRKAALIYAKYQLPRALREDMAPPKRDDATSPENDDF